MTDLHVLGAGGHAKVIIEVAQAAGFRIAGIYDDQYRNHPGLLGHALTGALADVPDRSGTRAVIAIGNNRVRQVLDQRFQQLSWVTLVHPFSWVSPSVSLGPGTVVMAGAVIQAQTQLGRHVIANTACTIDHDGRLGDYVHVAPGTRLAGGVQVHEGAFLGVASSIIPGQVVGRWSVVGAGAVVTKTVPANVTTVGVPAQVIKERPDGWQNS